MLRFSICILVAIACALAYICRFNLSATINYMCDTTDEINDSLWDEDFEFDVIDTDEDDWQYDTDFQNNLSQDVQRNNLTYVNQNRMLNETKKSNQFKYNYQSKRQIIFEEQAQALLASWYFNEKIASIQNQNKYQSSKQSDDSIDDDKTAKIIWSREQRDSIHGAFFWGYALSQLPGALLAEKLGAKSVLFVSSIGSALTTVAFPIAAKYAYKFAYSDRFLMGIAQGALFPSAYILYSAWLTDSERPKMLPYPSAASRIGQILMNPLVPIIVGNLNWQAIFYIWGAITLAWCVLWLLVASSNPENNKFISESELKFIQQGKGNSNKKNKSNSSNAILEKNKNNNDNDNDNDKQHIDMSMQVNDNSQVTKKVLTINQTNKEALKTPPISWSKLLLRTKSIWPLTVAMFASEWSNYILIVNLTTFLDESICIEKNTIFWFNSGLFLIYSIIYPFSGWLAEKISQYTAKIKVRKLFELCACSIQAGCCAKLALGCNDKVEVMIVFTLMMIGRSIVGGGQCVMPPEISREHSGTVFAFANTLACLACAIAPAIKVSLNAGKDPASWTNFWILSAIIFFAASSIFVIFGDIKMHNFKKQSNQKMKSLTCAHLTDNKNEITALRLVSLSPMVKLDTVTDDKITNESESQPVTIKITEPQE